MRLTRWIPTFLAFPLAGLLTIETVGAFDGSASGAAASRPKATLNAIGTPIRRIAAATEALIAQATATRGDGASRRCRTRPVSSVAVSAPLEPKTT